MSRSRIAETVLFDLDGTLVDSAADLLAAMNRLLAEEGRLPLPLASFRAIVSKGSRAMLAQAFSERDEAAREALVPRFLAHYERAIVHHSTPFDGIAEVLAAIEAGGARWGIVTNKPEYLAREVVVGMGWSARCAVLVGGDTLAVKKPDPGPLQYACAKLGVAPGTCVYVGDDERDVVAARAAGMKSVVALWGYREAHEDPRAWRADTSAEMPRDLLDAGRLEPLRGAA